MKKYLTLLFLVCAVALTFTGCCNSFESDGGNPSGSSDSLAGTTWMYEKNYNGMTLYTYTLKFTSEEKVTLEYKMMGVPPSIDQGTYTYSNKTVTLSPDTILPDEYESRGSVSGNKMTFKNTTTGSEDLVLTKQ